MSLTAHVLHFLQETRWTDLPPAVQRQAWRCLLDGMAALIAGTQTPVAHITAAFAAAHFAGGEATILATGVRVSPIGAALANGFAANALDMDDGYRPIKGHPGVCVLPALLAAAECRPLSGADFLTALVLGYEIAIRAGLIRHATATTYHSSGSWGAIAAAAVVGRVFGFDSESLYEAMGAAEYLAPIAPMMKGIDRPNMGKDSTGWGAMVGMTAALLAAQGFTGVHPLFDDTPDPDWVLSLGHRYEILNLYFKPYACCRWTQPAIAAALRLAQAHRLAAEDIAAIRVRTFAAAARLSRAHPTNTEEAQYNLAYPIAAALIDGELGPRQVLPPRLFDPTLLALADRVEVEVEPEYEAVFPARALAEVTLLTIDGRELNSGPAEAPWDASQPPTDEALRGKFLQLTTPVLGAAHAQALAGQIEHFAQEPDARVLVGNG